MASRCHSCTSPLLTEISMTMTDGSLVDFVSCHKCETKSWKTAGQELPLDRVLSMAEKRK
jgi:uncharacterized protein with PIN domain